MHKISIITVNYNNCNGLQKTIKSVLGQNYNNIEYIIIDAGSTDGSVELIKETSSSYPDSITYWSSEKDSGIYDGMNKGIRQATGDYCLFLNSGDWLYSSKTLSKVFENTEYVEDLIIGRQVHYSKLGYPQSRHYHVDEMDKFYFYADTLPHQCTFIKTSLLEKIGGYHTDYKIVSDWIFWYEAVSLFDAKAIAVNVFVAIQEKGGVSSDLQKCLNETNKYLLSVTSGYSPNEMMRVREAFANELEYKKATRSIMGKFLVRIAKYLDK